MLVLSKLRVQRLGATVAAANAAAAFNTAAIPITAAGAGGAAYAVSPRRLAAQVRYLTMRFGAHARRWQLVLWLRQLTLFAISVALDVLTNQLHSEGKGDADVDPYRYVFAGLCIVTLLGFWLWHHRKQPCDRAAAQTL